jgi:hypothetical protein
MDPMSNDERRLDTLLQTPLLEPPEDFDARVMAALPARPGPRRDWRSWRSWRDRRESARRAAWPSIPALLTAACAGLGAFEVLLFVGGLWASTTLGAG